MGKPGDRPRRASTQGLPGLNHLAGAVAQGGPLTSLLRAIQERQTARDEMVLQIARLEGAGSDRQTTIERKIISASATHHLPKDSVVHRLRVTDTRHPPTLWLQRFRITGNRRPYADQTALLSFTSLGVPPDTMLRQQQRHRPEGWTA